MRISDWSSDVCSSDLEQCGSNNYAGHRGHKKPLPVTRVFMVVAVKSICEFSRIGLIADPVKNVAVGDVFEECPEKQGSREKQGNCRSDEHTSELQSLMRLSYAVFCYQKKPQQTL